ncbi:imelysin family protein [Comamonas endophytica]|uniref:Iron-regulated protein n=1 Tax=Comamonas endophytica TaxID=2949090 RepID=A0ABY6GAC9_9BURK|nr:MULTISPECIES: imelysin family protein [unclassified Acidovorax]MCD2511788.1 iron-regulated protein [Acidovorax sp. D4N7]UYG51512.1 iron-regulated protein [Acidovorax sp. 5MLIR]
MHKLLLIAALVAAPVAAPLAQPATPATAPAAAQQSALSANQVAAHYAQLVHAGYSDSLQSAQAMQKAIDRLLAKPSADTLAAARKAWLQARDYYGQTEAFRFYDGPIDSEDGPEARMNAWPMDESYVDYVQGNDKAGIINDRQQAITAEALSELNEKDGEENIATGWHAIEFLLWGQDLSATGPGARPHTDFVDGRKPNADRRRQYLKVITDLLIEDLRSVQAAWAPNVAGNYRAEFVNGGNESIRRIFVGLGSLSRGELAGERLEVALASQDQEDEHSCFSDNTHNDAIANAKGIENVWLGEYKRLDGSMLRGPGVRALVAQKDAALAEETTRHIRASVAAAQQIPAPFDQAIQGERSAPARARIQAVIDHLIEQSKDLAASAQAVGIERLNIVQPK